MEDLWSVRVEMELSRCSHDDAALGGELGSFV